MSLFLLWKHICEEVIKKNNHTKTYAVCGRDETKLTATLDKNIIQKKISKKSPLDKMSSSHKWLPSGKYYSAWKSG